MNHRIRKVTLPSSVAAVTAVSAASFGGGALASESIVAAFGVNLAATTQAATSQPLPTSIAGVSVKVRDSLGVERLGPLILVSPTQINFQVPPGAVNGAAMITVINEGRTVAEGSVRIELVAPGIFTANADGRGALAAVALVRNLFDGSEVIGGRNAPVIFLGAQGGFTGLDQMNVELPFFDFAGLGEVDLVLTVDGIVANTVRLWIK